MSNDLNTGQMHKPGDILLKRFRVEKFLGKGTFAEVYRVMHSHMNVPRAIKVLRKDTRGSGSEDYRKAMERFKIEVQLGSQLDHPNVIKVYDCEEKAGELFLIMECADGGSLKDRLDRGKRLSVEEAVRLGVDICNGLMVLHEKLEAIHRDIKPSNILFAADGIAKIGDLGLAQISGSDSLRSELGTSFSPGHPGTPEYMSPEQESTKGYLLPSSDIFSLGCVLFEALTGKLYKKVYGTHVRDHRADIPLWLDDIVARALAEAPGRVPDDDREPTKRYRKADILRDALERGWQEELHRREEEQKHREAEKRAIKDAEERARRADKEQAQHLAEQRTEEINRLKDEAQSALRQEDWKQAEKLASELAGKGDEGKSAAASLQEQIYQARQAAEERTRRQAEQHAAEITSLQREAKAALSLGQAKRLIAQLENLGADGQFVARRLREQLPNPRIAGVVGTVVGGVVFIALILSEVLSFGGPPVTPTSQHETSIVMAAKTSTFTPTTPTRTPTPMLIFTPQSATFEGLQLLIAEGGTGKILIVEMKSQKIIWEKGGWWGPTCVSIMQNGHILVCEYDGVTEIDREGNKINSLKGVFGSVGDVAALGNNNILVSDGGKGSVMEMDWSGNILWSVTGLHWPSGAVRLSNGHTLVADGTAVLHEFDSDGNLTWSANLSNWAASAQRLSDGKTIVGEADGLQLIDQAGNTIWSKKNYNRITSVNILPTGDFLFSEPDEGKVLVITRNGDIIWTLTGLNLPWVAVLLP